MWDYDKAKNSFSLMLVHHHFANTVTSGGVDTYPLIRLITGLKWLDKHLSVAFKQANKEAP